MNRSAVAAVVPLFLSLAVTGAPAQTQLWSLRGTQPDSTFGSVTRLGDLDGDGVPEFAVGEPGDFVAFSPEPGRVAVYSGRDRSLLAERFGDGPGDCFGFSVADAGDVDGDGTSDLIVGAMQWIDWMKTDVGYVRIFSGADFSEIRTIHGLQQDEAFGVLVAGAGDVDADGHDDVLVSAQWETVNGVGYAGAMHVFSGADGADLFSFGGTFFFNYCGTALAGVGDLDADGHDDFLVGSFGEIVNGVQTGAARVFSGIDFHVLYTLNGALEYGDFGMTVTGGGDVNGDGVPDFAVAVPAADNGFELGRVNVYSGADGALLRVHGASAANDFFGTGIDLHGDLDGDGTVDLVVGAPLATYAGEVRGACYAFSGATGTQLFVDFGRNAGIDPYFGGAFGIAVAAIGDGDGDGRDELLVGASGDVDPATDPLGAVYLLELGAPVASWQNYGSGWPGTLCEPTLTVDAAPALGTSITLSLANSAGVPTTAILLGGFAPASIPLPGSGTLLVAPPWITLTLGVPTAGLDLAVDVEADLALVGLSFYAQALEFDLGASKHLSFTPGLALVFGGI